MLTASQQNTTLAVALISGQEYAYHKEILLKGLTALDVSIVDAISLQRVSGLCFCLSHGPRVRCNDDIITYCITY